MSKTIRLYELPKGAKIILTKDQEASDGSRYIEFDHIDGMYSYCKTEKGGVIHLSASTPLKKVSGGYQLLSD